MDIQNTGGKTELNFKTGGYCPSCLKGKDDCTCLRNSMKMPSTPPPPVRTLLIKFVTEFINEFPETNLDYLRMSADRFIENNLPPVLPIKTAEQCLRDVYDENDSQEDNLQLAITLNPSLEKIIQAMELYRTQPEERLMIAGEAFDAGNKYGSDRLIF
jgi:hypothetical protein